MKRIPFQSLLCSPLSTLLLCVLLLVRLACAQTPPAATPMPTAFWHKVETAPQTMMRRIVDLEASSDLKVRDVLQVPRKREIDVDAGLAYRTTGEGADAGLMPFWIGQVDLNASGYTVQLDGYGNGTQQPLFDPQKYIWNVEPSPIIPLAPPYQASRNRLFEFGYIASRIVSSLAIDQAVGQVAPWAVDLFTASLDDHGQNYAADGRPLEILKPGISTPNKHFYWDLGALRDSTFPQTATTIVKVTGEGEADGIYPAQVKVNFQLPTRTVFDVEIELYNWVDNTEAPLANFEEFRDKLLLDDEFQNTVVKDTVLKVVEVGVDYVGGKIIARVVVALKAPAKKIAQRLNEAVQRALNKPAKALADGTVPPFPEWYTTHGTRVTTTDRAKWRPAEHISPPKDSGPGTGEDPDPTPTPDPDEDADGDGCPDVPAAQDGAQAGTRAADANGDDPCAKYEKGEDSQPIEGHFLYFYTQNPSGFALHGADRWTNPNANLRADYGLPSWPAGYYLTDLEPQAAAQLRQGQLSFLLFGHPYAWSSGGSVSWVRVFFTEADFRHLTRRSFKRVEVPTALATWLSRRQVYHALSALDRARAGGSAYQFREDGTPINDNQPVQDTVAFQTGTPGADDVPDGIRLPRNLEHGRWNASGQPGNGVWESTKDTVKLADLQMSGVASDFVPVPFARNFPDFTRWIVSPGVLPGGTVVLPLRQRGYSVSIPNPYQGNREVFYDVDLMEADKELARLWGWVDVNNNNEPQFWRVWHWREMNSPFEPGLTWHHHEDMRTMQLVPKNINNEIPHQGGASFARESRW